MPWIVGIDEAGYGPNLGPFVMSLAAIHVPAQHADTDLWQLLSTAVCRARDACEDRLVVDDSKAVYSPSVGLARLERNLLPFVWETCEPLSVVDHWQTSCRTPLAALQAEPWFEDGLMLPLAGQHRFKTAQSRFMRTCRKAKAQLGPIFSVAVFPRQVNELITRHNSKGAVPAWALGELLTHLPTPMGEEPTRIYVDKLGGRDYYQPILQSIFPDTLVLSRGESAEWSSYQVANGHGVCHITFMPKADSRHWPVALASMASKYLREVAMEVFNRFWRKHVADLEPTAGYPGDSQRFFDDIRAARERLHIADDLLWRRR